MPPVSSLLALGASLALQDPAPPTLGERVDAFVAPFEELGHLSGTLFVARGEEVLLERSWGLARREPETANTPETAFCVASITKPLTVVLAIGLIEEGALAAEDPLSKWIEGFPRGDDVTVDHLLNHRAGIPHRLVAAELQSRPWTAAELVEHAARAELVFEPGSQSVYSSGGYTVLARVLELAGGRSYGELLQARVFEPAGMRRSSDGGSSSSSKERASAYVVGPRGFLPGPDRDVSFLVGAGSVWSTPRDLWRAQRAILTGTFGGSVRASLLRADGFAWNGVTAGYRAFADYHAGSELHVVFAGNVQTGAIDALRAALPRLVAGEAVEPPLLPTLEPVAIDPAKLSAWCGKYEMRPGSWLDLQVVDGILWANEWLLVPIGDHLLFSPQDYGEITVVVDADGRPERLDWRNGEQVTAFPRSD